MTKNKKYHYQCKLERKGWHTVTWIPDKYAKVGKIVKLGNHDWEVIKVYSKMDSRKVQQRSVDYKSQREASDI